MPNYDYKCSGCKTIQEISHPMTGGGNNYCCPDCGGRLFRVFGNVFFPRNNNSSVDASRPAKAGNSGCPSCFGGSCSKCSS